MSEPQSVAVGRCCSQAALTGVYGSRGRSPRRRVPAVDQPASPIQPAARRKAQGYLEGDGLGPGDDGLGEVDAPVGDLAARRGGDRVAEKARSVPPSSTAVVIPATSAASSAAMAGEVKESTAPATTGAD